MTSHFTNVASHSTNPGGPATWPAPPHPETDLTSPKEGN